MNERTRLFKAALEATDPIERMALWERFVDLVGAMNARDLFELARQDAREYLASPEAIESGGRFLAKLLAEEP